MNLPTARFIGQEDDGSILFAWDATTEIASVTCVGLYLPSGQTYRTLYEHGERVEICSATVNHERTLLSFTVDNFGFVTYVAEIQPQGRVFNLNIDVTSYRRAQFLHQDFSTLPPTQDKVTYTTSRLLVAVIKECVSLYQFKLQLVDDGAVLSNKPKGVSIIGKFDWYQWSPKKQWLYYACFDATWTDLVPTAPTQRGSFVFSCLSFARGTGQALVTISLPLPYPSHTYTANTTLHRSPFALVAPVQEINLQVLHRSDGLWCVGLQHSSGATYPDTLSPDLRTAKGGLVDYSLYIIHSGHVLYGQVLLPSASASGCYLHFMLVGNLVAVYAPGLVLHLLNVGPNVQPTHHLALDCTLSPMIPGCALGVEPGTREVLSPAVSHLNIGDDAVLVECRSQTVYHVHLNPDGLFELFKSTSNKDLRVSLLHLTIVSFRHHAMARAMIEHLCCNPSPANMRAFAEFMVSSAYSNVAINCQRYITKQLPSTASPMYDSCIYRDPKGLICALLTFSQIPLFQKQLHVQSDQKWKSMTADALLQYELSDDSFDCLCFSVAVNQAGLTQLNVREAVDRLAPNILTAVASKVKHKKVVLDTTGLPFLRPDEDFRYKTTEHIRRVKQALYQAIAEPVQAKENVRKVIKLYCSEMERRSQELLSIAWYSIGMNSDNHPLLDSIHRLATAKEKHLFEVLEAYRLAHMDLGIPTPNGFHTLFACVGYLSLDPDKFLQCMSVQHMFTPTRRFVQRLAQHGNLRQESAAYEVLCALEEPLRQYAFHLWANRLVEQTDEI